MIAFAVFISTIVLSLAQEPIDSTEGSKNNNIMKSLIESLEQTTDSKGLLKSLENVNFASNMAELLENITLNLKTPVDAYNFLQSRGMEKIVAPVLQDFDIILTERVIIIFEKLFKLIPNSVNTVIPYSYLSKVMDAFESNISPVINRHAVEVLKLWMLKNLDAQTHVIKLRGLHTFYEQLPLLDADVFGKVLNLGAELIKEHINIRDNVTAMKVDKDTRDKYMRMGLLDKISTYDTCIGFINIYEEHLPETDKLIVQLIDLLKIMKQFCLDKYVENYNVISMFDNILRFVSDDSKVEHFETIGLNATDAKLFLQGYLAEIEQKTEL